LKKNKIKEAFFRYAGRPSTNKENDFGNSVRHVYDFFIGKAFYAGWIAGRRSKK